MDEKVLFEKLDRIIELLEKATKEPPILSRVAGGFATGVGIMGIFTVIDIIKKVDRRIK